MFATFSGPKKVSLSSSSVQVQEAVTRAVALDLARPVKATGHLVVLLGRAPGQWVTLVTLARAV